MLLTTRALVDRSFIFLLFLRLLFAQQSNAQEITETKNSENNTKLRNIISNIQNHRFSEADHAILEMGVLPTHIAIIVNAFADIDFAIDNYIRGTSEISISTAFVDALCNHMESTGRLDVYKLMALDSALSRNIKNNQENTTEGIRSKAKSTIDRIRNLIVTTAAQILLKAALEDNFHSYNNEALVSDLLEFNDDVSELTMLLVADELCLNMTIDKVARTLFSKDRVSHSIMVLWWISAESLFTEEVDPMLMADYLRTLQQMPDYANLPKERLAMVRLLVSKLPESIRNLYFSDCVCIRNVRHSEYLSPPALTKWDYLSRYVFISPGKYPDHHWKPKKPEQEHVFEFVSQYNTNEYLYESGDKWFYTEDNVVYAKKLAMTSIPGESVDKQSQWQISAYKGNFLIKNSHFNEILCTQADGLTHSPGKRMVVTEGEEQMHGGCEWTFESC